MLRIVKLLKTVMCDKLKYLR